MTDDERSAAEAMALGKLSGGEKKSFVVAAIRSWLIASRDFKPTPATTRAREVVDRVEKRAATVQHPTPVGLYEAWHLPGSLAEQEGTISASEAKSIGAIITVKGLAREFRLKYENRWGDDLHPWKLRENRPVGTKGAEDDFVVIGEFSTMTSARAEARMLARGGGR